MTAARHRGPLETVRRLCRFSSGGANMPKLNAPSQVIFLVSLILAIVAVIGVFVVIPFVTLYAFWIAIVAYVVLALGCVLKGM